MINKKKLISIILLIIFLILIIGGVIIGIIYYTPKEVLTIAEFKKVAKKNSLQVEETEIKDQNGNPIKEVKNAINAESKLGWKIEYYILENQEVAKNNYNANKRIYSSYKNQLSEEKEKSRKNYDVFTLKTQSSYMHVCRVENTVLAISADDEDEKNIEKVIRKLGYN